jgi:hypothetical protein
MTRTDRPRARRAASTALAAIWLTMAAGCGHLPTLHWPWHGAPAEAPLVVHELVITTAAGAAAEYPQFWKRNTLMVDLRPGGASGSIVMKPREHTSWPVRLGFRMLPGQFGTLEVRANQRVVLPITSAGSQPVDLELAPGVFIMKTPQITVVWGAAAQPTD